MKKILAVLLTLCMMVGVLASCGASVEEGYETRLDFYERLAEAISEGDDDELEAIVEEIKEYGEELEDKRDDLEDIEEDYNKEMEKIGEDLTEIREDEKVTASSLEALEEAIDYAEYYASYLDEVEDVQAVYDEIIEVANEAIAAAKEKDSAEVRDIAIDFRDDYYGKYRDCQEMSLEYGDKFGELDDEYADKLLTAVS